MTGVCDANLSNYSCGNNYSCMGPEITSKCRPCREVTEGFSCRCDAGFSIENCTDCYVRYRRCTNCLDFYFLNQKFACDSNFCSAHTYQCADKHRCPSDAVGRTNCEPCQLGQLQKCKCNKKENCQICSEDGKECGACLLGYDLKDGNCVLQTNICDQYKSNSLCDNDHFCDGKFGDSCVLCTDLKNSQSCRCQIGDIRNCIKCSENGCEQCLTKYIYAFGACVLNTCGQVQNTLNCGFGNYCKIGSSPNEQCLPCDGSQECNCGGTKFCKTCGMENYTCGSCFYGYSLINKKCVRTENTCGENFDQSLCVDNFYCKSKFGDNCSNCSEITLNSACKCGNADIQNCSDCANKNCTLCISGYYQINNKCVPNVCISGQPAEVCALNNYCPGNQIGAQISCEECYQGQVLQCNCGGAQNCSTCIQSRIGCRTCLKGYLKSADTCIFDNNICDKDDQSTFCDTGNFCNGVFGDKCFACSRITQGFSCFCQGNLQLNCSECNGGLCKQCISGYLQILGICQPNFCDNSLSNQMCQMDNICVSGSKPGDQCQECKQNQTVPCNCGVAQNCSTCGTTPNTCQTCLEELVVDEITKSCVQAKPPSDNVCDDQQTSKDCQSGNFCNWTESNECSPCTFIELNYKCNCDDKLQINCTFCVGEKCASCLDGFYPIDGECVLNTCGDGRYNCQENFLCPENALADTPCQLCSHLTNQPCNCGSAQHCQTCSIQPNKCQNCLQGFILQNDVCIPPIACDKSTPCPNFNFCNNGFCTICDIQNVACSCEKAQNCQKCGFSGYCISCIHGWQQDTNGNCTIPVCTIQPAINQYCASPDKNAQCSANDVVINSMINPCNCGPDSIGCALCLPSGTGCALCMKTHQMMSGQCILITPDYVGACDQEGSSSLCAINHGCNGFGECVPCAELPLYHACKCENDTQIMNCGTCLNEICGQCLTGSTLIDGACAISCKSQIDCGKLQMCGPNSTCVPCDGSSACWCGEMENCSSCAADGTCESCLDNYVKDKKGSCKVCAGGFLEVMVGPVVCEVMAEGYQGALSVLDIIGCVFAGAVVVAAVVFVVWKVVTRPKRYSFQHNVKSYNP